MTNKKVEPVKTSRLLPVQRAATIFARVSDEQRVVSSARLIAGLTLCSRILGLIREGVYAQYFGTSAVLSAFRIAFMIPNLARRLFGEGALSAAFIPVFARAKHDDDIDHAPRLAGSVFTLLSVFLIAIVLLGEAALLIALRFHPESSTLKFTAIMLPFMAFVCVAAYLGGLLNTLGRFGAPAASPMLLNVLVIVAIVVGAYSFGLESTALVYAACAAVLCAGIAQVALQLWSLHAVRFQLRFNLNWKHRDVREIVTLMGPMVLGLSAVQLNTLADILIADYFIPDGKGPAVLGYAHFMYQLPLGVFGIAIATAIFPLLASHAAAKRWEDLSSAIAKGLRLSFFISMPSCVGLILLANPLVTTLFERGAFGEAGTQRVSRALVCYSLGLCFYATQHLLVRAFYALKAHNIAARVAAGAVVVNIALNFALVGPLAEAGIALATVISAVVQVTMLALMLRRRLPPMDLRGLFGSMFRSTLAAVIMAAPVAWITLSSAFTSPAIQVVLAVPGGALVYALASRLLRQSELNHLLRRQ